jgi:hypothetical protein
MPLVAQHRAPMPSFTPLRRLSPLAIETAVWDPGEDRHRPRSDLMLPWRLFAPRNGHEAELQRAPWPLPPEVHRGPMATGARDWCTQLTSFSYWKTIQYSCKFQKSCTEALGFSTNSDLAPVFTFYLKSSPCKFQTLYLFNRNSVLSDFCTKSFVATKHV